MNWILAGIPVLMLAFSWPAESMTLKPSPKHSPRCRMKTREECFFDRDRNGILNFYEYSLIKTYRHFHWPMADSKDKRGFDVNGNGMLEPFEEEKFTKAAQAKKARGRTEIHLLKR